MVSRLGGVRLQHPTTQELKILQLQRRLAALDAAGYEVLQCDEGLFSADSFNLSKHWSRKRRPLLKTSRFTGLPKIVVCGVISPLTGNVYYHYG